MKIKHKQIGWEKWRDPFGNNIENEEWPGAFGNFNTDKMLQFSNSEDMERELDDDELDQISDEDIDLANKELIRQKKTNSMSMIMTPMGAIPLTEHTNASYIFNFWIAHTNFRMTNNIKNIIDNTDGVETFDIFTPYRWRISIGKAFDSVKVKNDITKKLGAKPLKINNDKK